MIYFIIIAVVLFLTFTAFTGAPLVPSRKDDLKTAFEELYPLSKKDTLIDLGAGTGTVLKAAQKYGTKTIGIELNPLFALIAKLKNQSSKIVCQNFYKYHFPKDTTVIYLFGDSRDIKKMYQKVQKEATRIKKPLYLLSLAFPIPNQKVKSQKGPYYLYKILP